MSSGDYPWKDLQIEKTDDKRTIKRAYTKILKTIDVDANPDAFIALREAYDYALGPAQWEDDYDEDYDYEEDYHDKVDEKGDDYQPEIGLDFLSQIGAEPEIENPEEQDFQIEIESSAAINENLSALNKLLNSTTDEPLDTSAMKSHYRAIQSDPALEQLYVAESVENALADMVIYADQKAATLLRMADIDYGWAKRADTIGLEWPLSQAAEMAAAQIWLDEQEKGGSHKAALKMLRSEEKQPSRWDRFVNGDYVQDFIDEIDVNYPGAEFLLNQGAVDAWRKPPEESSGTLSSVFNYFICLPVFAYLMTLRFEEQFSYFAVNDISFKSLFSVFKLAVPFMVFFRLRTFLINDQVSVEGSRQGGTISLFIEITSYLCLLLLPLIAVSVSNSLIATICLALLSGAALIGSGARYIADSESFLIRWYLRIGPLLCILLVTGYLTNELHYMNIQVLIPVYALIWVMINNRNRFDELRFLVNEKIQKSISRAVIVASVSLFIANVVSPQFSISGIGTEIFGYPIPYYNGIMIMLVMALCAVTEFFHEQEDGEIRVQLYLGYVIVLGIVLVFAVPIACLVCAVRMKQVLDRLA